MNLILLLFVLPFATIIFSIVLQRIIRSPVLVALTVFSIFLILAFTVFDESFLIIAILYTILSYITAVITRLIKRIIKRCLCNLNDSDNDNSGDEDVDCDNDSDNDSTGCGCNRSAVIINENCRNRRYWR